MQLILLAAPDPDPLEAHDPVKFTSLPGTIQNIETAKVHMRVPSATLADRNRPDLEDAAIELYEWLSLIRLESPRIAPDNDIDPYLSRYSSPGDTESKMRVCKISWQGFISADWLRDLAILAFGTCSSSSSWFSLDSTSFSKNINSSSSELLLLKPSSSAGEYLTLQMTGTG